MSHTDDQTDDVVQRGLRAWTNGDLDAWEAVLDPRSYCAGSNRASGTAPDATK